MMQQVLNTEKYCVGDIVEITLNDITLPRYIRITKVDESFGVVYYNNPLGEAGSQECIGIAGIKKAELNQSLRKRLNE